MTYAHTTSMTEVNKRLRFIAVLAMLVALVWTGALPARADAPSNDTIEGSVAIEELPFWAEVDTSEATTDEGDAALNEECEAPATDASVWYNLTPEEDLGVEVLVDESTYTAGVIVAVESEGELHVETCGPGAVFFLAQAGVTYQLLVFDDQLDGEGNGGTLVLHVEGAPVGPPPEIDVTVDPIGYFTKEGDAVISGTVTCTGEAEFVDLFGELEQQVGRFTISGFFFLSSFEGEENGEGPVLTCDGSTQSWTATVDGESGLFRGGKATLTAEVFACGFFDCTFEEVSETIRLLRLR